MGQERDGWIWLVWAQLYPHQESENRWTLDFYAQIPIEILQMAMCNKILNTRVVPGIISSQGCQLRRLDVFWGICEYRYDLGIAAGCFELTRLDGPKRRGGFYHRYLPPGYSTKNVGEGVLLWSYPGSLNRWFLLCITNNISKWRRELILKNLLVRCVIIPSEVSIDRSSGFLTLTKSLRVQGLLTAPVDVRVLDVELDFFFGVKTFEMK